MIYFSYTQCSADHASEHDTGVMLRNMLFSFLSITDPVMISQSGRPYIDSDNIDFSVTHSRGFVMCAVIFPDDLPCPEGIHKIEQNGTRIGIDAELINPCADIIMLERISKKFLGTSVGTVDGFYDRWTRHEAFGKLCGEGFMYTSSDEGCIYRCQTLSVGSDSFRICICSK